MLSDLLYPCHDTMNSINLSREMLFNMLSHWDPKNSRFSSTLTLALTLLLASTLALALAWVLSLRTVRHKIGEYYFNRGNFDDEMTR